MEVNLSENECLTYFNFFINNLANYHYETLYLVVSGNLQGQYVYKMDIGMEEDYTKKCSSILGRSYVSSTTFVLLIADKLELNIFFSPSGAYQP